MSIDKRWYEAASRLYDAGIISAASAREFMGLVPPPLPVVCPRLNIGDTIQLAAGPAVITHYDPENRRIEVITSRGETLQFSDRELAGAPVREARPAPPAATPSAEPALIPVTVTRERSIMLD